MTRIFDGHCDTGSLLCKGKELYKNDLHLDISRMKRLEKYIQVFAAYTDVTEINTTPMEHCLSILKKLRWEIERNSGDITLIDSKESLDEVINGEKNGGILAIEGGEALRGEISALKMYYGMGVRLITLTWNHANEIADGIGESRGGGLTEFGREVVSAMEDMGILIDVSHLSVKGFWDVVECTKHPFCASHSCVKELCNHPRNLDNDQISAMIERDCVIGVNFYPLFLNDGEASMDDVIRHIEYIVGMGGENCVGLGSDFDGVDFLPQSITGAESMPSVADALINRGFSAKQTNKILFDNFYRLFYKTITKSGRK
ncbi:MAG: dipeptidase [Clostridia bacterium]|nr:dipeptidase [Clostridia bacterium]